MEHPQIEQAFKTGYPEKVKNCGSDVLGNEVIEGDDIIITPDGEVILADSLDDYLIEVLGFRFEKAE